MKNQLMMNKAIYVIRRIENFEQMLKKLNHKLYGILNDDVSYSHMEVKGIKRETKSEGLIFKYIFLVYNIR